ncbi:MAG: right-handed parallel beta-helix repeat-containing protein [Acidithiobacillales bacterium]
MPAVLAFPRLSAADAAPFTVFVSAVRGADTPHCGTVRTPCRTFQAGVDRAAAAGTVVAVDSGTYGAVVVTKGVTIEAPTGVTALIETVSEIGVDIQAGAQDTVVLRGLTLVSQIDLPLSIHGIRVESARSVHIEKCVIDGYAFGIFANAPAPLLLFVTDTSIRGGFSLGAAVNISSLTSTIQASFDHCRFEGHGTGLLLQVNGTAVARNCSFIGNLFGGAVVSAGPSGTSVELSLENCSAAHIGGPAVNSSGRNGGSATIRISNCTIVDNVTGVQAFGGGVVLSRGNNTIEGNGTDVSGTLGAYPAK